MLQILIDTVQNTRLMAMMFAAVAAIATILTLAMPLLADDPLERRMKSVTDIELLMLARLAARGEQIRSDDVESLSAAGFLPRRGRRTAYRRFQNRH